jgi:hypothetical protein
MPARQITPTCGDPRHARAGWGNRKRARAVAIVRRQGYRGRWTVRCADCLTEIRAGTVRYDVCLLQP